MGAAASMAVVAPGTAAAIIFVAGVACGAAASDSDVVNDALYSVFDAAEAVMDFLRTAASWAFEKLKAAAAFVKEIVIKLVRRLRGRKQAAAARREVGRAAAAADQDDVVSRASARVARFGRLQDVKALPPPSSSSEIVSSTAPGGALVLHGSVAAPAARAARRASEMIALHDAVFLTRRDAIPEDARSCISAAVAAVGICLEAIATAAVVADA